MTSRVFLWTGATILFLSLFEASVLSNLHVLPVLPDLVLLVIVYVSFTNGSFTGSSTGFVAGFMVDFLSAAPVGLNSFIRSITGYLFGKCAGAFNPDRVLIPALMGCAATVLKVIQISLLSFFFGDQILNYQLSEHLFWLELALNTLAAPVVFWLMGQFPNLYNDRPRNA